MQMGLLNNKILILLFIILSISSCTKSITPEIWMVGDSTMAKKPKKNFPESGWGEGLKCFVAEGVKVHNHGASGRSTLSFINEGLWQNVLDSLQASDFVIIQFGHNDEKSDSTLHTEPFGSFKNNLKRFVSESKAKGAHPIICSSIERRHFKKPDRLSNTHGDYISAANQAAIETNTPYINLKEITADLLLDMGPEYSKAIFTFDGNRQDSTHLNNRGAKVVAFLFAKNVQEQNLPLANYFDLDSPLLIW